MGANTIDMSKQLTLVYQTDAWHTHASKVLVAVCTSKKRAITTIKKFIKKEYNGKLTEYDLELLNDINQTQSDSDAKYPFEGEFILETVNTNEVLI